MKLEDENFEEEFLNWLNNKSKKELIDSLKKYKKEWEQMKEIKVGDYIRRKNGYIGQVQEIIYDDIDNYNYYICEKDNIEATGLINNRIDKSDEIINSSDNILELLQNGDILEVEFIIDKSKVIVILGDDLYYIPKQTIINDIKNGIYKIKRVLTKELFEEKGYKLGE